MEQHLQVSKGKQFQPQILYSAKLLIKHKSQTKIFSDRQSLKIFASCVPFPRKILEAMLLESESKWRTRKTCNSGDGRSSRIPWMPAKGGLRSAVVPEENHPD